MAESLGKTILRTTLHILIGRDKKRHAHGDPTREVFETIVFVVVLVLLLKLFVAEAFVIPTGSMASTLWGDQVRVTCPECGQEFPVTRASRDGFRQELRETFCQNCGLQFRPANATEWNSGDRVLVGKYEYHVGTPQRFDVPVFKFPKEPYSSSEKTAMNYIKRLIGLPGETIAIHHGDLFRATHLTYADRPRPTPARAGPGRPPELDLWQLEYTYPNDPTAVTDFQAGKFEPIRKSPREILAVRRLVFDLDRQPKSLSGVQRTRWHPDPSAGTGWEMTPAGFRHVGTELGWMRYHHVEAGSWRIDGSGAPTTPHQPALILDHLAYNVTNGAATARSAALAHFWVPDLILECEARFSDIRQRLILELNKGSDKFRAVFESGKCSLFRVRSVAPDQPVLLAEQPTRITRPGTYALRFANVDSRLTVWVDGKALPFGAAADYPPDLSDKQEPTTHDLHEPARIGADGAIEIQAVKLWRDVYYTCIPHTDAAGLYQCALQTFYVHPGHYLCLGDNSSSSSDGRDWGLVPERLMLGKAVVIYWPLSRIRVIR